MDRFTSEENALSRWFPAAVMIASWKAMSYSEAFLLELHQRLAETRGRLVDEAGPPDGDHAGAGRLLPHAGRIKNKELIAIRRTARFSWCVDAIPAWREPRSGLMISGP